MVEQDPVWQDNSDGDILQFDFVPPPHWTLERIAAAQQEIAASVEDPDDHADLPVPEWLRLVRRLPAGLRSALVAELRAGNWLVGIGSSGWPSKDSVVVNLRERFSVARKEATAGVTWRELNDPHYCREELSQNVDGLQFLVIT